VIDSLAAQLFILVLSTFLGLEVIKRVSPLLHTPLMSLTNAISAISLVASLVILGESKTTLSMVLGGAAVVASTINVVSGFLITDRMLKMFKTRDPKPAGGAAHLFILPAFLIAAVGSGEVNLGGQAIVDIAYLVSAVLFILSLQWMNKPITAKKSVIAGEVGMGLAVFGAIVSLAAGGGNVNYLGIVICLAIGAAIGYPISLVPMTAVPERTAASHAFGGLAVGLVGTAKYFLGLPLMEQLKGITDEAARQAFKLEHAHSLLEPFRMSVISFEVLLGFVTFTGSLIAFGKLAEKLPTRPLTYKGQNAVTFILLAVGLTCAVLLSVDPTQPALYITLCFVGLIFGVLLVIPIGGADMPTVISLLNSYAGLAASAMGFVLGNPLLIIAGALDGASGLILSIIMCKAMNRSFTNVLFGAFGQVQAAKGKTEARPYRSAGPEEAGAILEVAQKVVIVPGYGMAVSQAQHKVRELYDLLTKRGVDVYFAIHPVAGRMPGHMNVLLAEADIPYDKLIEMDEINPEMGQVDVVLIIGANDVTNPVARTDETSPIYGMPIIDCDKARTVMVIKRSMSSGFAGIDNDLYYMDKTLMLFGDAKGFLGEIIKSLGSSH
jgi:H+-translocating NAD(P) transhydrogenase subunit beta